MEVKEYFEKMYKDGTDGITTLSGVKHTGYCPFCGGTEWDLDDTLHEGITFKDTFSCNCGAEWEEYWNLTKIERTK